MKFPIDNSLLRIKFANYTTLVSVLRLEFIIKNCGNKTVFIVLTVFIIRKCCNGSLFIVSSVYYLLS